MDIRLNDQGIRRFAEDLRKQDSTHLLSFTYSSETPYFPPLGASWAVSFFFLAVAQLFDGWEAGARGDATAIEGPIDGQYQRGRTYLWKALWRAVQEEPDLLTPGYQAALTQDQCRAIFRSDQGGDPVPDLALHHRTFRDLGASFGEKNWTPHKILNLAKESPDILGSFLQLVGSLGGYREDPGQRRTRRLAFILSHRPEKFLPVYPESKLPVFVDRSLVRLALRWGLLEGAEDYSQASPEQLTALTQEGVERVLQESKTRWSHLVPLVAEADAYCPEGEAPRCQDCCWASVCAQKISRRPPGNADKA